MTVRSRDQLSERQRRLLEILEQSGGASVRELSERCGVSEMTIRRDLDAFEGGTEHEIARVQHEALSFGDLDVIGHVGRDIERIQAGEPRRLQDREALVEPRRGAGKVSASRLRIRRTRSLSSERLISWK